ncbi:type IV pilus modification protein PilV [Halomonas sp. LR5S13]|uniref:type IV pilus modification protein PilV n=1 Tax=Halomonas rhizosphaerae TaxID=3043296 RepID=UPI0024A8FB7B|nr:type IV pilus modification protein PilV [Halomonas rhizosphaerae]MDI5922439.1 type IV pilus modification protein PilV [Halomonas rhizosphaerae]
MMTSLKPLKLTYEGGFTLLEALLAVLVLSIGLLGVAGMQLKAMQSAQVAYQRSIATLAAQDAVERLWASVAANDGICSSASIDDWASQWDPHFPGTLSAPLAQDGCRFAIDIQWSDDRFLIDEGSVENVSNLKYLVRVPGSGS